MTSITIRIPRARWLIACPVILAAALLTLTACGGSGQSSGQSMETTSSNDSLTIAEQTNPAPVFKYSVYRYEFNLAQAIEAFGTPTTSFVWGDNQGPSTTIPPGFSCPSIGEPIPVTTQATNPQKVVHDSYPQGGAALTVGNIDPNQLYTPPTATGTDIMCVTRSGGQALVYSEPNVTTVPGAARWVQGQGIVMSGAPHMPVCKVTNVGTKKAATVCTK